MKLVAVLALTGGVLAAPLVTASPAAAINTYNAQPAPERTEVGAYLALWDTTGDGVPDRFGVDQLNEIGRRGLGL